MVFGKVCLAVTAGLSIFLLACSGGGPSYAPDADEFSVMTYNLHHYSWEDRDRDGQRDDPKPPDEKRALMRVLKAEAPDVLVVQELGTPEHFDDFRESMKCAGLAYSHTEYVRRGRSENNLALFSRFPIVQRLSRVDDTYQIGEAKLHVARGFLDVVIQVNPGYSFRCIGAHLKSKVYHPLGQTEMRRNEARLLGKHIRNTLEEYSNLNVVVVGDMNDFPNSAALREVTGKGKKYVTDLRPVDLWGDAWTWHDDRQDVYNRFDYILVSDGMYHEVISNKCHAVRHKDLARASDHRPLVAVFSMRERSMR